MGTLAGSTVMLLTIAWGGSVIFGRCDIDPTRNEAIDKKRTKPFNQTGITVASSVRINAVIMLATLLLYLIPQIATFSGKHAILSYFIHPRFFLAKETGFEFYESAGQSEIS